MINRFGRLTAWILVAVLLCGGTPSSVLPFDPHIEGLQQVGCLSGAAAIDAINKLHGMPIDVVQGFVVHYKGARDKAAIWVSEAQTDTLATQQIDVMITKKRRNHRSPFSRYRELQTQGGVRVVAFEGLGQVHYVFGDGKWVYWISADAGRIDHILNHVTQTR